ncbi:MAG: tRNA lysidine(34) synthetase TilS, partial [Chloroflexi bacterium]|nr:tRNA lysidine(34) synthetase TilS [Chloroflexota bacterium]
MSRCIAEHEMLPPGAPVVVGVSGGPDSLCLLHVLLRLRESQTDTFSIHVAHLNHGLRGEASQADADSVAGLATGWGLPVTVETADVRRLARERRLSVEEAARQARYAFLAAVAAGVGAPTVAVAHNADDQAETVLMHFLRGSGVGGLRGMLPETQISDLRLLIADGSVSNQQSTIRNLSLIRPLLTTSRSDIAAYCAEHNLEPRFDASNLDTTYFRNRLRHAVLPALEKASPGIRDRLLRLADVAGADAEVLRSALESARSLAVLAESPQAITFDLGAFRSLPLGLRRALVRDAAARLRSGLRDIDFLPVEAAAQLAMTGHAGARAPLPGGLSLTLSYDTFRIAPEGAPAVPAKLPLLSRDVCLPVAVPGVTRLPESPWALSAEVVSPGEWRLDEIEGNEDPWRAFLSWDTPRSLMLRARKPGDRFQPHGMGGAGQKISDFMITNKIPAAWRESLPLLTGGDAILWVCG